MISSCSAPVLVLKGDCQASSALALRKITRYVFAIYCFFFFFFEYTLVAHCVQPPSVLFVFLFVSFFFFFLLALPGCSSYRLSYTCAVCLCVCGVCVCLCVCVCMCVCESHYCIFFFSFFISYFSRCSYVCRCYTDQTQGRFTCGLFFSSDLLLHLGFDTILLIFSFFSFFFLSLFL